MAITNHNIIRRRRVVHIPWGDITGAKSVVLSSLTLSEGTPNTLSASTVTIGSYTAAAAVGANINSTGETGLKMSTNGNAVLHDWLVPFDLDPYYAVELRLNWCTESTTDTHGAAFTVTRKAYTRNSTALSATVSTALDTAIAADTVPTGAAAYALLTTEKGVINAGSLTPGEHQTLKITMTTKTGATDVWLRGIEIQYVPLIGPNDGPRGNVEASTWT